MAQTQNLYPAYGGNGVTGYYDKYNVQEDTVLIGRVGFYCGSIHITKSKSWVTDNALIVSYNKQYINLNYMRLLLTTSRLGKRSSATAQPLVTGKIIYPVFVAIPPINEQQRIVGAIEKYEPLVAEYGKLETEATELDNTIKDKLKKSILQYAIQGKLVPQDKKDEPASLLLERIRAEKKALLGKKYVDSYIYKGDDNCYYEHINGKNINITNEVPFDLPDSWIWDRLDNLGIYRKGPFGSSLTKDMFVEKSDVSVKVYEQKNAIYKSVDLGSYYISQEKYKAMKSFETFPEDILVSCAGTIGESFVLPIDAPKGIINQALMRIKLFLREITNFYLLYFDYVLKKEAKASSKGSAIKNIPPFEILKKMLMPIPPLAEQQRIVAKIDEIFSKL